MASAQNVLAMCDIFSTLDRSLLFVLGSFLDFDLEAGESSHFSGSIGAAAGNGTVTTDDLSFYLSGSSMNGGQNVSPMSNSLVCSPSAAMSARCASFRRRLTLPTSL